MISMETMVGINIYRKSNPLSSLRVALSMIAVGGIGLLKGFCKHYFCYLSFYFKHVFRHFLANKTSPSFSYYFIVEYFSSQ